jgi:hypothetical protein
MAHTLRFILAIATAIEFLHSAAILAIFVHIFANNTTTILWHFGGAQGWNSDPSMRVYDYANYREPPPVPLVWDPRCEQLPIFLRNTHELTHSYMSSLMKGNFCIAIVTMLIWVVRCFVNFWDPYRLDLCATLMISAAYDIMLIA